MDTRKVFTFPDMGGTYSIPGGTHGILGTWQGCTEGRWRPKACCTGKSYGVCMCNYCKTAFCCIPGISFELRCLLFLSVAREVEITISWPGHRWPATSSSLVCSRGLPVFRHRSVLCPLGIPTHSINETVLRCCPQSELVSHRIRTNAQFSLQQTSDYL